MQTNQRALYLVYKSRNRLNTQTAKNQKKKQKSELDKTLGSWQPPAGMTTLKIIFTMGRTLANNYHFARKPSQMEMSPIEATTEDANEDKGDTNSNRHTPTRAHQHPHKVVLSPGKLHDWKNTD